MIAMFMLCRLPINVVGFTCLQKAEHVEIAANASDQTLSLQTYAEVQWSLALKKGGHMLSSSVGRTPSSVRSEFFDGSGQFNI